MALEWATKVFQQVRTRAPELWRNTLQAFGRPPAARGSALPLSRPPRSKGPFGHEMAQPRPRREDTADHPADEVSKVLG
jgi:hypothetical protein